MYKADHFKFPIIQPGEDYLAFYRCFPFIFPIYMHSVSLSLQPLPNLLLTLSSAIGKAHIFLGNLTPSHAHA